MARCLCIHKSFVEEYFEDVFKIILLLYVEIWFKCEYISDYWESFLFISISFPVKHTKLNLKGHFCLYTLQFASALPTCNWPPVIIKLLFMLIFLRWQLWRHFENQMLLFWFKGVYISIYFSLYSKVFSYLLSFPGKHTKQNLKEHFCLYAFQGELKKPSGSTDCF